AAGLEVEVFSIMPPNDTHFQEAIARVRAPVQYIPYHGVKAADFWAALDAAAAALPGFWKAMEAAQGEDAHAVYQGALIASAERAPRIVTVGRLVEKKGFADLVEACALLKSRGAPFQCDVIGTGPLEPTLAALILERQLQEHVHLVGPRPRSEVVALVRGAAV